MLIYIFITSFLLQHDGLYVCTVNYQDAFRTVTGSWFQDQCTYICRFNDKPPDRVTNIMHGTHPSKPERHVRWNTGEIICARLNPVYWRTQQLQNAATMLRLQGDHDCIHTNRSILTSQHGIKSNKHYVQPSVSLLTAPLDRISIPSAYAQRGVRLGPWWSVTEGHSGHAEYIWTAAQLLGKFEVISESAIKHKERC